MFISSTSLVQLQEVLNPAAVAGHPGVDTGVSSGARADAPWRHSSLDPYTVLLANIGSATVTLWNIKNSCHTQRLYYLHSIYRLISLDPRVWLTLQADFPSSYKQIWLLKMLAPETPLHLLEHSVLAMLFIFASIREFEVDPDAS